MMSTARTTGAGRFWQLATVVLVWAMAISAGSTRGSELKQHSFCLQYAASGFSSELYIDPASQQIVFEKELDFGDRNIVRAGVPIGRNGKEFIGFAWDKSKAKLYLDLNRNLDLTDDPDGVFSSSNGRAYQTFHDIHFELERGTVRLPYVLNISFYSYRPSRLNVRAQIRSGFADEIELYGNRWYLGIADNMDGVITREDQFVLKPADDNFRDLGQTYPLNVPGRVVLDEHIYELSFEFQPGETQPVLQVNFEERECPMGQTDVQGKAIKRLILKDDISLVMLNRPEGEVCVPVGNYRIRDVLLDGGTSQLLRTKNTSVGKDEISVGQGQSTPLKIGGPLNNTVSLQRSGNILKLNYTLVGVGGLEYQPLGGRPSKPPTFAIYKGTKQIASGSFEYG